MTEFTDDETARTILRSAGPIEQPRPVGDALIAGWAEGRLDPERTALVEAHLAADDEARHHALAVREAFLEAATSEASSGVGSDHGGRTGPGSDPLPSFAAARARRATWVPFAAAAAVLLALGVGFLASKPTPLTAGDSDARLVAAAGELAAAAPSFFADFRPVGAAERNGTVADATRSGLTILEPAGHIVSSRPLLRWASSAGATSYEVSVADADGRVVWQGTTDRTSLEPKDFPTLSTGSSYLIEVSASGPLGRTTATRTFDVAEPSVTKALLEAQATAIRLLGDDLGNLAFAHGAARRGFLAAAERAVTEHLARAPNDAQALEFDSYLRRRLGWPERASTASDADRR